jgi:hypothetical protein
MQIRRGSAAAWASANPTLELGEIALESDTRKIKVGDGSTAWNSLQYVRADGGDLDSAAGGGNVFRAIPTMTDYTSPSGEVSGEGNQNPIYSLFWQAFDNNASTSSQFIRAGFNTPKRMIQYAFPEGQKSYIGGYSLALLQSTDSFDEWKMYGSDDLSSWTEIDSRSGITGWNNPQARQFTLAASANYRAYRWVFQHTTDNSGPNNIVALQLTE